MASATYIEKIKNESLKIERETDEVIVKKIQEHQEQYEKSIDIENASESDYNTLIQKDFDIQVALQEQYQKVQAECDKRNLTPDDE